ncbi:hypothetical protein [Oceaniradius stylonematis]|uniref:hypothetical protein n=1 Tax=Oceaniradius stylonematis TaxID=2184161 RepID=UPI003C7CD756
MKSCSKTCSAHWRQASVQAIRNAQKQTPVLVETVTVYRDPSCYHSAEIDLEPMITRFGRNYGCMHRDLAHKLRCTSRGSVNCGIQLLPAGTPQM